MQEILAVRGAKSIVKIVPLIRKNEKVFIVTDYLTVSSALLIAKAAYTLGAQVDSELWNPGIRWPRAYYNTCCCYERS